VTIELVGQAKGAQDVEIRARVEGFVDSVAYQEGTLVRKGQILYRIDPKPFEATLANAKADLATWQARWAKTENDVKRLEPLAAKQAVSQQELDDAVASREAAQAQVDAQNASVDKARLDLGYTTVTSPIDGLAGTTLVRAGALVGRGESTLLTTISQVDPILFTAGISEAEYLRLARRADELRRERGGQPVPVDLLLADGTLHPEKGRLDAIERAVDTTTGTLSLQFRFSNPDGLIRPGQYGRVRFVLETKKGALLVPQRSVQELQNLYNVFVVGPDNKLTVKTVTVGPRVGSLWVIEKGLDPGDRVVVEGAQRLRPGTVVTPKDAPPADAGSGNAEALPAGEHK
jgi:membrane fusion protein (multidrug efflux system)